LHFNLNSFKTEFPCVIRSIQSKDYLRTEMNELDLIYALDLTGTFVFAVSGWLLASKKQLDFFGASVIAFVTAIGGGTIRDLLIGSQPVGWLLDVNYFLVIALGILSGMFFKKVLERLRRTMFLFDSIGIGLFTILGIQKTLAFGLPPVVALIMGTISAVFGGVLRDTLVNEIPLIFRKEIYATVCLAGGGLYLLLEQTNLQADFQIIITIAFIIAIRILVVVKNWSLPSLK
jgi:uncharacterized membrane protein YeiH